MLAHPRRWLRFVLCGLAWSGGVAGAQTAAPPAPTAADYLRRGVEEGKQGRYDEAQADLSRALELDPGLAAAYQNRGYASFLQKKLKEAVADYDQAVKLEPKSAEALFLRGMAKGMLEDYAGAVADLDASLALDPKQAQAYHVRGIVHYLAGDAAAGVADDTQAIALGAGNATHFNRGLAYLAGDDRASAAADFQTSADSGYPYAALWLWIAKSRDGDHGEAQAGLLDFLKKQGDQLEPWPRELVNFYLGRENETQLFAAARQDPAHPDRLGEAYFYDGMWRLINGDDQGAADDFRKTLEIAPPDSIERGESRRQLALLSRNDS